MKIEFFTFMKDKNSSTTYIFYSLILHGFKEWALLAKSMNGKGLDLKKRRNYATPLDDYPNNEEELESNYFSFSTFSLASIQGTQSAAVANCPIDRKPAAFTMVRSSQVAPLLKTSSPAKDSAHFCRVPKIIPPTAVYAASSPPMDRLVTRRREDARSGRIAGDGAKTVSSLKGRELK